MIPKALLLSLPQPARSAGRMRRAGDALLAVLRALDSRVRTEHACNSRIPSLRVFRPPEVVPPGWANHPFIDQRVYGDV